MTSVSRYIDTNHYVRPDNWGYSNPLDGEEKK